MLWKGVRRREDGGAVRLVPPPLLPLLPLQPARGLDLGVRRAGRQDLLQGLLRQDQVGLKTVIKLI